MNKDLKIKHGFTLAEVFSVHPKGGRKQAFTLAEVLITLGIIGVVAAMTLPVLIAKHQKKVTVTKLKKAYTTLSQVIQKSYADNGSALEYLPVGEEISADVTKNFFNTYYLPYFKSPNIFTDKQRIDFKNDCQPFAITNASNNCHNTYIYTNYAVGRIFFSTNDGMTYFIISHKEEEIEGDIKVLYSQNNFIYVDINGLIKPNKLGKDIFLFVIDWEKNIIRPYGYHQNIQVINSNCSKSGNGTFCAAKIMNDGWEIKDDYPW